MPDASGEAAQPLPWFPFFYLDFRDSKLVRRFLAARPEVIAWCVMLLAHQWEHGSIPDDVEGAADICAADPSSLKSAWIELRKVFSLKVRGGVASPKLESIRKDATKRASTRSTAARRASLARWHRETTPGEDPLQSSDSMRDASATNPSTMRHSTLDTKHSRQEKLSAPVLEIGGDARGTAPKASPAARAPRASRNNVEAWKPGSSHVEIAAELHVEIATEEKKFRDHVPNAKRPYKDLDAAFRNWLRTAAGYKPHGGNGNGKAHPRGPKERALAEARERRFEVET